MKRFWTVLCFLCSPTSERVSLHWKQPTNWKLSQVNWSTDKTRQWQGVYITLLVFLPPQTIAHGPCFLLLFTTQGCIMTVGIVIHSGTTASLIQFHVRQSLWRPISGFCIILLKSKSSDLEGRTTFQKHSL